jgi:predicted PurR-regulated permease PerM
LVGHGPSPPPLNAAAGAAFLRGGVRPCGAGGVEPAMARLTPDHDDLRFLRRAALILLGITVAYCLFRIGDLLLLAFGAMLVAVLLASVADWLTEHSRLPRWAGLALAAVALLAVMAAIIWLFGAETGRQAGKLAQQLPQDWARLQAGFGTTPIGRTLLQSGQQGAAGGHMARLLVGIGWEGTEVVLNFIVVLIGGLFFAANPGIYRRGLVLLAPSPYRPAIDEALGHTATALRLWLLTQLFSMTAMGAMIAFGLWLSGIEGWGALGVLGGLSEFIPYVGPTIAMIPAVIVALAGQGSIWGVLGTYAVVRIIQANVITPLISQRVVSIPPGLYIFAILSVGFAFGAFGMFFSGALAVAGFTLVRQLYLKDVLGEAIPPPGHEG